MHLVRETPKSVAPRLGDARFVRIHRSTLVRRDAILRVARDGSGALAVVLSDGTELQVGRTYRDALASL